MTLEEWFDIETAEARNFRNWWEAMQRAKGKDEFPDEMKPSEWHRRFGNWL